MSIFCTFSDVLLLILAFFLPPVAVGLRSGLASPELWLNVILTMVGGIPGVIHAIYYIFKSSPSRDAEFNEFSRFYQRGWEDRERLINSHSPAGQDLRPNPLPEAPFNAEDMSTAAAPPTGSTSEQYSRKPDQKSKKSKEVEAGNVFVPEGSGGPSNRGYDIQTPLLDNPEGHIGGVDSPAAPPPYSQV